MNSRRHFLSMGALASAGAVSSLSFPGICAKAAAPEKSDTNPDGTWLTYAVNVEMTWGNLPFLERLRKVKEAGFSHYEFWPWRSKDIDAIISKNRELGLVPVQFSASPVKGFSHGITNPDPARREEFEEEIRSAVPVAKKLGVKKICVVAGEETKGHSREEQTQAVITALKAGRGSLSPRESPSSSSRSTFWSIIRGSSSSNQSTLRASSRPSARPTSRCSSTSTTSKSARETLQVIFVNITM